MAPAVSRRTRTTWTAAVVMVMGAYAGTWRGGRPAHERQLARDADRLYLHSQAREQALARDLEQGGRHPLERMTRDGGPKTGVDWCQPILPGVLVADSYYIIGPLHGRGGINLIVYYGFGCVQIGPIFGWIS